MLRHDQHWHAMDGPNGEWEMEKQRTRSEQVMIDADVMEQLRDICERRGFMLGKFASKAIAAALKREVAFEKYWEGQSPSIEEATPA